MKNLKFFASLLVLTTLVGCTPGQVIPVESVSIDQSEITVMNTKQTTVSATVSPSNATNKEIYYELAVDSYGTIDSYTGVFTASKIGNVKVFAYAKDTYNTPNPIFDSRIISVIPYVDPDVPVTSITINPSDKTIDMYQSFTFTVTVLPDNADNKSVTWASSTPSVATITSTGVVTGVGQGTSKITATAKDGSGVVGEANLIVNYAEPPLVTSINISPASPKVLLNGTLSLSAIVEPSNAGNKTVTWSILDTSVATINATSGLVNGLKEGTTTVTATANDGSGVTSSTTLTVYESTDPYVGHYYDSISSTATGTTLLNQLRTLNSSKRKKTPGYGGLWTYYGKTDYYSAPFSGTSGQYSAFYRGTSASKGAMNKEHCWPNSRGGDYVEGDLHMTRPTLTSDNSDRGNDFYVEGKAGKGAGWDPANCGNATYRGDSARIIFYCVVASSNLSLVDKNTDSTSNMTMGKLSDLLKWNLEYSIAQRENNRNEGAEDIQGNRNPFIDHPSYACKIWGNTNATTKSVCGLA